MAVAAAGLVAAGALMAMAGPIAAGAAAALPGDRAALALRHRAQAGDGDILAVIDSRSRALGRYGFLEWRRELATASLTPRQDRQVEPQALARSLMETRRVLSQAPASARDWLRLALIEAREGERRTAAGHLSMALQTGADMPRTRAILLDVAFVLWPDLPGEAKSQILDAMRHEWRSLRGRKPLMAQVRAAGLMPLAGLALSGEPDFDPKDWPGTR